MNREIITYKETQTTIFRKLPYTNTHAICSLSTSNLKKAIPLLNIIHKNNFKTVPWKNGKGETTELAINKGASLANFDWRISIASVVEDGIFSDFSGYQRNLVLIEGNSIELCHNQTKTDKLCSLLDYATFSGGCSTEGNLPNGSIKDFNIITNEEKFDVTVTTSVTQAKFKIADSGLSFVYSLASDIEIKQDATQQVTYLAQGDLLMINEEKSISVSGSMVILAHLSEK